MGAEDGRAEIEELKRRLKELSAQAEQNETLLKRTLERGLALLRADSLPQLLRAMIGTCANPMRSTR